jgi:hypothetical protein
MNGAAITRTAWARHGGHVPATWPPARTGGVSGGDAAAVVRGRDPAREHTTSRLDDQPSRERIRVRDGEAAGPYGAVAVRGAGLAQPNAAARVRAMRRARRDARTRALLVRRILLTR